jgi:hypothetical protein
MEGAPDYKQTLESLRRRYSSLRDQRRAVTAEMIGLIRTIQGLAALCGEAPSVAPLEETMEADAGRLMAESWLRYMPFVDAIRTALRIIYPTAFTTSELREFLRRAGYPIDTKTDIMIALNVSLRRFHEGGEVEIVSKDGRKAYKWAFKNEMSPPPGYPGSQNIDWEALVRGINTSNDEISDDRQPIGPAGRPKRAIQLRSMLDGKAHPDKSEEA